MTLVEDWKGILARAWTIKFTLLAAILGALELILPATSGVPENMLGWVSFAISMFLVPTVRVMAQKEVSGEAASKQ